MKLSIIIVNYNTAKYLEVCLSSVYRELNRYKDLNKNTEVIVVDNASQDNSVSFVKEKYPDVSLIENKLNLGFAKANNQGIMKAKGKLFLLLNSDVRLGKDSLINLLDVIDNKPYLGVVGCQLLNNDGSIQPSAGYFPNLGRILMWMTFIDDIPLISFFIKSYHVERKSFYNKEQKVDWVTGACMLIKREVIAKAGVMDEHIFMYTEEVEWCYRIRKEGYVVIYSPSSKIVHTKGGSAEGINSGLSEEFNGLLYFYIKHKPLWQMKILKVLLTLGAWLRVVIFGIILRNRKRAYIYAKFLKMVG